MLKIEYKLRKIIKERGYINIADFMELVISDPQYGYYAANFPTSTNLDFITAPEISQLFGELIGIWCASSWLQMGSPNDIALVELGPGRGTMMKDMLRATKNLAGFHQAIEIHMVEVSPHLQEIQQQNLASYTNINKYWHNTIHELPDKQTILVCNEFFDALPIHQYQKQGNLWQEVVICMDQATEQLQFEYRSTNSNIIKFLEQEYPLLDAKQIIEMSPVSVEIMKIISNKLLTNQGSALIIDYGYFFDTQVGRKDFSSSLQAVKNHKFQPVLQNIGEADLTALVDFNALKEAANIRGISTVGPIGQGTFLKNMGIDYRARMLLRNTDESSGYNLLSGLDRLTNPVKMGELFKVMALSSKSDTNFIGFEQTAW